MSRRRLCCSFLGVETWTRMRSSAPFPRGCTRTTPGACRNVGWSPVPPCCSGGETPPSRRGGGCKQPKSSSAPALHREGAASHLTRPALDRKKGEVFFPDLVSLCHYLGWRRSGSSHLASPFGREGQAQPCCLTGAAAPQDRLVPTWGPFQQLSWAPGLAPHLCTGFHRLTPPQGSLPASPQLLSCA